MTDEPCHPVGAEAAQHVVLRVQEDVVAEVGVTRRLHNLTLRFRRQLHPVLVLHVSGTEPGDIAPIFFFLINIFIKGKYIH